VLTKFARIGLAVAVMVLGGTTLALAETSATPAPSVVAQASPAPTASPNAFTYNGYVRAYDFYRQNAYSGHAAANQQSENNAVSLSGQYRFEDTGLSVGASYLYANPLSGCSTVASNISPALNSNSCYQGKGAPNYPTNPDNTLPSFQMSTLYQAYLQYKSEGWYFKGGDQVITTPWATAADSRLKPIAFQGADLAYNLTPEFTLEAADFWEWECRTCSDFDHGTLLTALSPVPKLGGTGVAFNGYSGAQPYPGNYYDPTFSTYTNNGFEYGRIGFKGPDAFPLTANAYYYGFDNIANALWFDAKYPFAFTGRYKAYIAAQGGDEVNTGSALLGKIDSEVVGAQVGFNPLSNVTLSGGFDEIPWKTDTVTLPSGFKCSSTHTISSPSNYAGNLPYFLPSSGTGNCTPGAVPGTANVYYGGWASPYTDSYAADPLFTTGGTQGMVDRRSAGASFKVAATFTSDDKQFVATVGQEWYNYNNPAYAQSTNSTDFDTQYFFSHVPKSGPYKGLSFRVRLFSRSESDFTGSSAVSLFKYSRFQAEYDF
jgi:hypothetical protein